MSDLSTNNPKRLLNETAPGIMHGQDAHIVSMAPDLDKEVLRLRTGVEEILNMCLLERDAALQDSPMRAGEVAAFNLCAERLADLLEIYNLGDYNHDPAEPLPATKYDHRLNGDE